MGSVWGRFLLASVIISAVIVWLAAVWFVLFNQPPKPFMPIPSKYNEPLQGPDKR
jgi:hypothetical protein